MVYRTALVSVTFNNPKPSFQGHAKYDITVYCKYRTSLTMQPLRYDIIIYSIASHQYGEIDLWKLQTLLQR